MMGNEAEANAALQAAEHAIATINNNAGRVGR
jgi:hypothetical protein